MNFVPTATTDEGFFAEGGAFDNTSEYTLYGNVTSTPTNAFVRFPNVTIPQGALIQSAVITFTAYASLSGTVVRINLYGNDIDDAVAPTNESEYNALSKTSAVDWTGVMAQTADDTYESPDISTIIQTIVNRAGWANGNALLILLDDNGSTDSDHRSFKTYETMGFEPVLTVMYATPTVGKKYPLPAFRNV